MDELKELQGSIYAISDQKWGGAIREIVRAKVS
jgi:hypothetical protein